MKKLSAKVIHPLSGLAMVCLLFVIVLPQTADGVIFTEEEVAKYEAVEFLRENPRAAVGLHLTLTSEWDHYKWGPVLPPEDVPSLLEPNTKYFWPKIWPLLLHANTEEVRKEIEAQVALAHEMGVNFTHFDSHIGWSNSDFIVGNRMFNTMFSP